MAGTDVFLVHETARIRVGKYAGLVGVVNESRRDENGKQVSAKVQIDGVRDDQSISVERWFKSSELERNQ